MRVTVMLLVTCASLLLVGVACDVRGIIVDKSPYNKYCKNADTPHAFIVETRERERRGLCVNEKTFNDYDEGMRYPK